MTVLVGVHDPLAQETWIATDEMVTDGDGTNMLPFRLERPEKWIVSGLWVVATAGQVAVTRLVEREAEAWKNCKEVYEVVDIIRDILEKHPQNNHMTPSDGGLDEHPIVGLVGHPTGLWVFDRTLDPEFMMAWTTGSGRVHALGALWAARQLELPIFAQVCMAIDAAAAFHEGCGGRTSVGVVTWDGFKRLCI